MSAPSSPAFVTVPTAPVSSTTAPTPSIHRARFEAALTGAGGADRSPVTAWQHHIPEESAIDALAARITTEVLTHDWDWVKVNPRATYLPEAWGNTYDLTDYTGVLPRRTHQVITSAADLAAIQPVAVAESTSLTDHVRLIERLHGSLGDRPLLPTVFSPLSILLELAGLPSYASAATGENDTTAVRTLTRWKAEHPEDLHAALAALTQTLIDYLAATRAAGADGVFYAVTGTVHPSITTPELFADLSTPYDDAVLAATAGWHIVHTCGEQSDPARFDRPGIHAIHWDQHAVGNPDVDLALKAATVGGVSHLDAAANDARAVTEQTARALALAARAGRTLLLAPACSVPPSVEPETYAALTSALRAASDPWPATSRPA